MQKGIFLIIFVMGYKFLFAQTYPLMEYRYQDHSYHELSPVPLVIDSLSAATPYQLGQVSGNPLTIDTTAPAVQPGSPGSRYTERMSADLLDPSLSYPLSTAVQLFRNVDGNWIPLCSGSMVGPDAVLSAAHCTLFPQKNEINSDSILVCPAYQNGKPHPRFGCSLATHTYWIKDWKFFDHDVTLLKIAEPLGIQTGWLGIGFEKDAQKIFDAPYLKLSYPNSPFPGTSFPVYNGDTMYFMRLRVNNINRGRLEVLDLPGIPGESGSSLVQLGETHPFTVRGVLSLSNNYSHLSFDRKLYSTLKFLLEHISVATEGAPSKHQDPLLYPNPSSGWINLHFEQIMHPVTVRLLDAYGKRCNTITVSEKENGIDLHPFENGLYFLTYVYQGKAYTQRILLVHSE